MATKRSIDHDDDLNRHNSDEEIVDRDLRESESPTHIMEGVTDDGPAPSAQSRNSEEPGFRTASEGAQSMVSIGEGDMDAELRDSTLGSRQNERDKTPPKRESVSVLFMIGTVLTNAAVSKTACHSVTSSQAKRQRAGSKNYISQ